jgi:hypothetical protein
MVAVIAVVVVEQVVSERDGQIAEDSLEKAKDHWNRRH